jgi:hypothetical protein
VHHKPRFNLNIKLYFYLHFFLNGYNGRLVFFIRRFNVNEFFFFEKVELFPFNDIDKGSILCKLHFKFYLETFVIQKPLHVLGIKFKKKTLHTEEKRIFKKSIQHSN